MKFRLCAKQFTMATVVASTLLYDCHAVRLDDQEDLDNDDASFLLAQAETSGQSEAQTEAETEFIGKIIDALFSGKDKNGPYNQRAPNVNVVDNARVMIPEGADPTAVKEIIGDIMNNGIGGIKGAMNILKDLGGPGGWGTWNLPQGY